MWKVFPKIGLVKALLLLICILSTSAFVWINKGWTGVANFFIDDGFSTITALLTPVLVIFMFITWLFGTYIWRLFWKIPSFGSIFLNQKVCPDLNGIWSGKTKSTFKDANGNPVEKEVEVKMKIKASFFGFDIQTVSVDGYQRSTAMQSDLYKDSRDGSFYISYLYEATVDNPEATDDSKFDGAAKLNVRFDNNEISLVGTYWTNRARQRGLQTAGNISSRKIE